VIRTWHVELAVVGAVLAAITVSTGSRLVDWLACVAVLASFCHGQVSDRLAEAQATAVAPVHCHRWSGRYWLLKESAWIGYFSLQGSWAGVAGAAIFAAYPGWRRWRRTRAGGTP